MKIETKQVVITCEPKGDGSLWIKTTMLPGRTSTFCSFEEKFYELMGIACCEELKYPPTQKGLGGRNYDGAKRVIDFLREIAVAIQDMPKPTKESPNPPLTWLEYRWHNIASRLRLEPKAKIVR